MRQIHRLMPSLSTFQFFNFQSFKFFIFHQKRQLVFTQSPKKRKMSPLLLVCAAALITMQPVAASRRRLATCADRLATCKEYLDTNIKLRMDDEVVENHDDDYYAETKSQQTCLWLKDVFFKPMYTWKMKKTTGNGEEVAPLHPQEGLGCIEQDPCCCCDIENFINPINLKIMSGPLGTFSSTFSECSASPIQCEHVNCDNPPSSCQYIAPVDPIKMNSGWCLQKSDSLEHNIDLNTHQLCEFQDSVHVRMGTKLIIKVKQSNKHKFAHFDGMNKVRHFVVDGELQLQNVVLKRGRAMVDNVLGSATTTTTTTLLPCLTISAYKQQQEVFNNYIDHAGASINLGTVSYNSSLKNKFSHAKLVTENVIFENNYLGSPLESMPCFPTDYDSKVGGGAIMADNGASIELIDTTFERNGIKGTTWCKGGALHARNGVIIKINRDVVFSKNVCKVQGNKTSWLAQQLAGAIYMHDSDLIVDGVTSHLTIEYNEARVAGGMYMSGGNFKVTNGAFFVCFFVCIHHRFFSLFRSM